MSVAVFYSGNVNVSLETESSGICVFWMKVERSNLFSVSSIVSDVPVV